ncbi:MAG: hypothetical protein H0T58_14070 [Gemmatimonadales bacterium]|nr:hypothetical protein [Gemmatimonadales bacterium]
MTYTFKLARRLAVSRTLALSLFAACSGGDATAPDSSPAHPWTSGSQDDPQFRQTAPVAVSISPSKVTVETNQLIRFLAHGTNSAGDSVGAFVEWSATGGTILPDGRFSAAATGTFMVIGRSPQREKERIDTAIVEVVRRQIRLNSIEIAPGNSSLAPGLSQTFLVTGYLKDGRAVPVGATWAATGGTIDAGGKYVAGDTAGTYHVIATHTVLAIVDTAIVTISAPAPPPPPPPAVPPTVPPAPELVQVTLVPASATLAPFTTRQFVAFGRTANGDSIPLTPASATGGSLTETGLYSAGSTAGTFRVIASSGSLADTSTVVVTAPLGSGPAGSGIPFGLQGLLMSGMAPGPLSMSSDAYRADNIVYLLSKARARNIKVLMNMTGGSHANYMTNGVFDMAKWRAKMDTYNTPAIKAAVAQGVADGTILGNSVMDEPANTSTGTAGGDANSWGPAGTITKPRLDEMARYVKAIFPTLPVGFLGHHEWRVHETLRDVDFAVRQYSHRLPLGDAGNVARWRDEALAQGAKDGLVTVFSLNPLNGGIKTPSFSYSYYIGTGTSDNPEHPEEWSCALSTTGGRGLKPGNCRMHSSQVEKWGKQLGVAGVGLMMWRYDSKFVTHAGNQAAFAAVAAHLAPLQRSIWKR